MAIRRIKWEDLAYAVRNQVHPRLVHLVHPRLVRPLLARRLHRQARRLHRQARRLRHLHRRVRLALAVLQVRRVAHLLAVRLARHRAFLLAHLALARLAFQAHRPQAHRL